MNPKQHPHHCEKAHSPEPARAGSGVGRRVDESCGMSRANKCVPGEKVQRASIFAGFRTERSPIAADPKACVTFQGGNLGDAANVPEKAFCNMQIIGKLLLMVERLP